MNTHLLFLLAYDGSRFYGFQKTKEGPSIEQELEQAVCTILQEKIVLQAASRTDRGVHAQGQVVDCFCTKRIDNLSRFCLSLNQLLPPDIQIMNIARAPHERFHATLSSIKKRYLYQFVEGSVLPPLLRTTHWHVPYVLDIYTLKQAASECLGTHDFQGFSNYRKNLRYDTTERTLYDCSLKSAPCHGYTIHTLTFEGDRFLYKMARTLAGTLIWISRGKLPLSTIQQIFSSKTRSDAGITAPAHGLVLAQVFYQESIWSNAKNEK